MHLGSCETFLRHLCCKASIAADRDSSLMLHTTPRVRSWHPAVDAWVLFCAAALDSASSKQHTCVMSVSGCDPAWRVLEAAACCHGFLSALYNAEMWMGRFFDRRIDMDFVAVYSFDKGRTCGIMGVQHAQWVCTMHAIIACKSCTFGLHQHGC